MDPHVGIRRCKSVLLGQEHESYLRNRLFARLRLKLGLTSLRSRILLSLAFFGFLSLAVPFLVGLATGDILFNGWEITLAFVWLAIGGLLIEAFEFSIDAFSRDFQGKLLDEPDRESFRQLMKTLLGSRKNFVYSVISYIVFFALMRNILAEHRLVTVIMVDLLLIPASLMWGIFANLALNMYHFVEEVCRLKVKVNVFDPDGFGGFGTIGELSIRVTALVSSGSLYIPFAFNRLRTVESPLVDLFSLLAIGGMTSVILVTFLVTVLPVHRLAQRKKIDLLDKLGKELAERLEGFRKDSTTEMKTDLEFLLKLENYRELKLMRVWPFDSGTLLNLAGLIFIPFGLFVLGLLFRS